MRYRDRLTNQTVTTERQLPASRYEKIHEDCRSADESVLRIPSRFEVRPRDETGRFLPRREEEE